MWLAVLQDLTHKNTGYQAKLYFGKKKKKKENNLLFNVVHFQYYMRQTSAQNLVLFI